MTVNTASLKFGIFQKMLLAMLLVALVPLIIIWYIDYRSTINQTTATVDQQLSGVSDKLTAQVNDWVGMNLKALNQNAALADMKSMDAKRQTPILRTMIGEYQWSFLAHSMGPDGMNVGRSDDKAPIDYSDRVYFKKVMEGSAMGQQVVISNTGATTAPGTTVRREPCGWRDRASLPGPTGERCAPSTWRRRCSPRSGFPSPPGWTAGTFGHRGSVEVRGFEPLSSSVRGKRSAGLSYTPKGDRDCRGALPTAGSLGFESYPAMTMAGAKVESVAADQYNHCVVAWKQPDGSFRMLDPTWAPFSMEEWSTAEGEQHYVVGSPGGEDLTKTPPFGPELNTFLIEGKSKIGKDGALQGKVQIQGTGYPDTRMRRAMAYSQSAQGRAVVTRFLF